MNPGSKKDIRRTAWRTFGAILGITLGLAANHEVRTIVSSAINFRTTKSPLDYALKPNMNASASERHQLNEVLERITSSTCVDPALCAAAAPTAFALTNASDEESAILAVPEAAACWKYLDVNRRPSLAQIWPLELVSRTHRNSAVIVAAYTRKLIFASAAIHHPSQMPYLAGSFPTKDNPGSQDYNITKLVEAATTALQIKLLAAAHAGEALEPKNAFWPLCSASAHMRLNDDKSMFADLDRAFQCSVFDEYETELAAGACRLYKLVSPVHTTPTEWLKILEIQSGTVAYDFSRLYSSCAWKAMLLEHGGHQRAGMAIRTRLAKIAALIMYKQVSPSSLFMSESLLLRSMHGIGGSTAHVLSDNQHDDTERQAFNASVSAMEAQGDKTLAAWFRNAGGKALKHEAWLKSNGTGSHIDLEALNTSACYVLMALIAAACLFISVLAFTAAVIRIRTRFQAAEPAPCEKLAKDAANGAIWLFAIAINAIGMHLRSVSLGWCIVLAAILGTSLLLVKRDIRRSTGPVRGIGFMLAWLTYAALIATAATWQVGVLFGPAAEEVLNPASLTGSPSISAAQAHLMAAATMLPLVGLFWYSGFVMRRIKYLSPNVAVYRLAKSSALPVVTILVICFALLSWKTASYEAGFRATLQHEIGISLPIQ